MDNYFDENNEYFDLSSIKNNKRLKSDIKEDLDNYYRLKNNYEYGLIRPYSKIIGYVKKYN